MILIGRRARLYQEAFREISEICRRTAKGDMTARVLRTTPYGELAPTLVALNDLLDQTDAFVRESGASLRSAAAGRFTRPFLERGMHGDFRRGAATINDARSAMRQKSEDAARLQQEMTAQREAMEARARAERAALADEFEGNVLSIASAVNAAADGLAENATGMAQLLEEAGAQSHEVADAALQATQNTQAVASAAEQMSASVREIDARLQENRIASQAVADEAKHAEAAVAELGKANRKIDEVVEFIRSVAFQTNLLALNASVEAARAGEAGKGFAVVAQEVRNLAQKTAEAAKTINDQIGAIQQASDRTAQSIAAIGRQADELNSRIRGISEAVGEQASATGDISHNIQAAAGRTQAVSGSISSVSDSVLNAGELAVDVRQASSSLSQRAGDLIGQVKKFLDGVRGL